MHDTEHPFYAKSAREQRVVQIRIAVAAVAVNTVLATLCVLAGLYPLPLLFIAATLSVIAPFFDQPAMKKRGDLVYYSSLFVAERERNGVIKVHGGSLLDYAYVIDRSLNGTQRINQVLIGYIDGLLNLLAVHRDRDLSRVMIRGTSYIVNERTARRIGLKQVANPPIQVLILAFNFVNLTVSLSLARGRLSFPTLSNTSTYEGRLSEIAAREHFLISLRRRLASSLHRRRSQ